MAAKIIPTSPRKNISGPTFVFSPAARKTKVIEPRKYDIKQYVKDGGKYCPFCIFRQIRHNVAPLYAPRLSLSPLFTGVKIFPLENRPSVMIRSFP